MTDRMVMYFITMAHKNLDFRTMKCMGYYKDFDDAKYSLTTNELDINETIYDFAMIEEISNGLYADDTRRWWFKFDYEKNIYEECETPKKYKRNPFPLSLR
jgi:hypothetical protein